MDLSVTQPDASGRLFQQAPPAVLPRDGKPQRTPFTVRPDSGSFERGRALVDVYVGLYDAVEDEDVEARDAETVRVGRCR